jgi:hypothetical protein
VSSGLLVPEYETGIPPSAGAVSFEGAQRLVYHVLLSGFELMQQKPQFIDRIFEILPIQEVGKIKKFIAAGTKPNIVHGFPRRDMHEPLVISILTSNERTEQSYLNSHMGVEQVEDDSLSFLGELEEFESTGAASVVKGGRVQSQIETWIYALHPDILHYTYALAWVILHSSHDVFESWGVSPGEITGGDVQPDPKFLPDYTYIRRLVMPVSGDRTYVVVDEFIRELAVNVNIMITGG